MSIGIHPITKRVSSESFKRVGQRMPAPPRCFASLVAHFPPCSSRNAFVAQEGRIALVHFEDMDIQPVAQKKHDIHCAGFLPLPEVIPELP